MNNLTPKAGLPPLMSLRGSRVPLVYQAEAAECGLACLCMVANYHGHHYSMTQLRQKFAVSMRGLTLKSLMHIATHLKLSARALKLELSDLSSLALPAILHWNMEHFVVLKRVSKRGLRINDPACGERDISWQEANTSVTGIAVELQAAAPFTPEPKQPGLTLRSFWQQIHGLKRSLMLLFTLSLLIQVFAIASPYYMQTVIDDALVRQQRDLLTVLALGFGLLLAIDVGTTTLRRWVILSMSSRLQLAMSANVFSHLIRLPLDYFFKRQVGDVVTRFNSLAQVREFLTVGMVTGVLDGIMAILTLVVMAIYSVKLCLIVIAVTVLYALVRLACLGPVKRLTAQKISASAQEQSHFLETLRAMQTVRQFNQETSRQGQWQNLLAHTLNADIRLGKWDIRQSTANQLLFGVENILVIYIAALGVMDNLMTIGMLYAFISYKNRFITSFDGLLNKVIELRMLGVHLERLADIVYTPTDNSVGQIDSATSHSTSDHPDLIAENLAYAYSSHESVTFSGLNLRVSAGEIIAITGTSGIGKTSLLKCLMGMTSPTEGRVRLGEQGINIVSWMRKHSASVMQDDNLFNGTLSDNICCFDEQVDHQRVVWAANQACIHDEIMAMPMQYQSRVGDMGSALSGGQRQRLLLARALYKQPRVLFLDEASSQLDLACEQHINRNLKALNMTRIIVAHRPHTIAMADAVYVMQPCGLQRLHHIGDNIPASTSPQGEQDAT